ncbi:MAG: hypothetical protein ACRDG7_13285 [Candidatus Limnocylindria bacterium]
MRTPAGTRSFATSTPQTMVELHVSLTGSDEMVERGLPGFEAAWHEAENSAL